MALLTGLPVECTGMACRTRTLAKTWRNALEWMLVQDDLTMTAATNPERRDPWVHGEPHSFQTTWRATYAITIVSCSKKVSKMAWQPS